MEAWPAVAWLLLTAGVASWLRGVQSRDFSAMDIIMLHPSSRHLSSSSSTTTNLDILFKFLALYIFFLRHCKDALPN